MRSNSGGNKRSFGKKDSSDSGKSYGKGRSSSSGKGEGRSFVKKEESGEDGKPKRRSYVSADYAGPDKKARKTYSDKEEGGFKARLGGSKTGSKNEGDSSFDKKARKDYGDKFGEKKSFTKRDGDSSYGDKPKKDYGDKSYGEKRSYSKKDGDSSYGDKPRKDYGDKTRKEYGEKSRHGMTKRDDSSYGEKKPYSKRDGDSSYGDRSRKTHDDKKSWTEKKTFSYDDKPRSKGGSDSYSTKRKGDGSEKYLSEESNDRKPKREYGERSFGDRKPKKEFGDKSYGDKKTFGEKRPFGDRKSFGSSERDGKKRSFEGKDSRGDKRSYDKDKKEGGKRPRIEKKSYSKSNPENEGLIRLNKYIANSGVCSRREADKLIESGAVTVNGKIVAELGFKVSPDDVVTYGGQAIARERKVYLLLNKPKDYITTLDDPEGRKTVMELVKSAAKERIYPVGRLDRNTTGLLLMTNDGDMAMKLTHPKHNIQKMYAVDIDKGIKPEDLQALKDGFELEDGFIKADRVELVGEGSNRKEIGIEIHSGRNRIVRRMFEHLGYNVVRLDRVMFAGLTKKDLPRAKWRFLSEKEVQFLKMLK